MSKINDPKIVTERLKKDIIKLLIDEVVMDKTDIPGTFNAGATLGPVNETNMARIWNKHKQSNTPLKRKVFVGMSGGVDSSVAATLLKKQGYEVIGVFIKVWEPPGFPCAWREDRRDAMRVAAKLGIPFLTLDLSREYKRGVVDYMIKEYRAGRTPNPDVMCNREIKFGAFYQWAMKRGATFVATGHYVRYQISNTNHQGRSLMKAVDRAKDQSYFLWNLTPAQLAHTLFPIGDYQKSEVRKLAKKFGLPTAEKKDSQGLCFIGQLDLKEFLKNYIKPKPGKVVDEAGKAIGRHDGVPFYTIGERHGFAITKKSPSDKPYYVVAKNVKSNVLIVSTNQNVKHRTLNILLQNTNWLVKPEPGKTYQAQIRYHGELLACTVKTNTKRTVVHLMLDSVAVAPGQSLVIYDGEVIVGGGIIG
ncbi:MAG: tRNA 2-thiouridine(34) synthase MnmA [Candidatus Vogelbacteria bacterium]|nr:tRNA 2-thiouridine(34) synthase MnmA [Candidatus Vogelbacteria bacterium]